MLFSNTRSVRSWAQGSKPISKKVPMTKFLFKQFLMLFLTFLILPLKNLQKTENYPFQVLRTFVFDLKVASKPFSKKLSQKTVSTSLLKNSRKT